MDLRAFYQRIRAIEESIETDFVVVVSESTPDGGKAGVLTEVSRAAAARLIAERRVRLANPQEADAHRSELAKKLEAAVQEQLASRLQFAVVSESDLRKLRERPRPQKD